MAVRRAREGDFEAVHPLLEQLVQAAADRRRVVWIAALRHEGYAAWVAEVGQKPVDSLICSSSPTPRMATTSEWSTIWSSMSASETGGWAKACFGRRLNTVNNGAP